MCIFACGCGCVSLSAAARMSYVFGSPLEDVFERRCRQFSWNSPHYISCISVVRFFNLCVSVRGLIKDAGSVPWFPQRTHTHIHSTIYTSILHVLLG